MTTVASGEASRAVLASAGAARVMHRCRLLAQCTDKPGEILRTFLSPGMKDAHRTMRPWMEAVGMAVWADNAGNLHGLYPGATNDAPRLLIASHLDTVPNAGAYDGVLGVLLGLALVESVKNRSFPFAIEIIGFSDEEGTRFGAPFLGSRALVGELDPGLLACVDGGGISLAEALRAYAQKRPDAVEAALSPHSAAYLEFHIEQGPVLESRNLAVGVVEGLVGQSRCIIIFRGYAGHAGTTPMNLRRDAMAAAAEWITAVEAIASRSEPLVATVGQVAVEPGAVNVIPGLVRCSLDVRHADDRVRQAAVQAIFDEARRIAARRNLRAECSQYHQHAAVRLDPMMVAMAERAAGSAGFSSMRMTSGAGHDAMILARHLPSAMIFLRNPGGVSHHPEESVTEQDVAAALQTGLCFLDEFAAFVSAGESNSHA